MTAQRFLCLSLVLVVLSLSGRLDAAESCSPGDVLRSGPVATAADPAGPDASVRAPVEFLELFATSAKTTNDCPDAPFCPNPCSDEYCNDVLCPCGGHMAACGGGGPICWCYPC